MERLTDLIDELKGKVAGLTPGNELSQGDHASLVNIADDIKQVFAEVKAEVRTKFNEMEERFEQARAATRVPEEPESLAKLVTEPGPATDDLIPANTADAQTAIVEPAAATAE